MATISIKKCDICGKECETATARFAGWALAEKVRVVFETEQNEGTRCRPYMDSVQIDICPECYGRYTEEVQKCIDSFPLRAMGAMGHNSYKWKEE